MRYLALLLTCYALKAQTTVGPRTYKGAQDASGAVHTAPVQVATSDPPTCTIGEWLFRSDATAGSNVKLCTTTNTWTSITGAYLAGSGISLSGTTFSADTAIMLSRATDQAGTDKYCVDAGGDDTYVCGLTPALTAYTTGQYFILTVLTANTGAATLNIDSLGPITIKNFDGTTLTTGAIGVGPNLIYYNGTNFIPVNTSSTIGGSSLPAWFTLTNPSANKNRVTIIGGSSDTASGDRNFLITDSSAVPLVACGPLWAAAGPGCAFYDPGSSTNYFALFNFGSQAYFRNQAGADILVNMGGMSVTTQFVDYTALATASGTPSAACFNGTRMVVNAALTCTVSNEDVKSGFTTVPGTTADFMNIQPLQFEYNDHPGRVRWGFGAKQVASVNPALADGWRADGQPWSLDQNAILALTVKTLQEQTAKIAALEAQLAAR